MSFAASEIDFNFFQFSMLIRANFYSNVLEVRCISVCSSEIAFITQFVINQIHTIILLPDAAIWQC